MFEYIPAILASVKTSLGIIKTLSDVKDTAEAQSLAMELNTSIIEIQQSVIAAQGEQANLFAENEELKRKIDTLNNWDAERDRYTRVEITAGCFAYLPGDAGDDYQGAHKYCCNCFDNHRKSTLQQGNIPEGSLTSLTCPSGCRQILFYSYLKHVAR